MLVESDMFMDAISAATSKKEVRKRKRTLSSSKELETNGDKVATSKESKSVTPAAPLKFYQDTLDDDEHKESKEVKAEDDGDDTETKVKKIKTDDNEQDEEETSNEEKSTAANEVKEEPMEEIKREPGPGCGPDGPPGVLTIHRRKGPKKSLRWKPQELLEEVRFFELDENERVNVTKTFIDMKQMERVNEREVLLNARKLGMEDLMVEQTAWVPLIIVDDVPEHPMGVNSKERIIQADREKTCLKTIYFDRASIPDSPHEPDVIALQNVEPPVIPLFDVTGNPDAVHDFTNMPWPEPKGSPPHKTSGMDEMGGFSSFGKFTQFNNLNWPQANNLGGLRQPIVPFRQMLGTDATNLNPMPAFPGPQVNQNFGPANAPFINNMHMGNLPQLIPDSRNIRPNWLSANNTNPNNNWQQMGQMNQNPNNNQRSNWISNRRVCKQFQRGYCRHGDSCKFLHPGVNCPPF